MFRIGSSPLRPVAREVVEWDEYTGRLRAVETVEVRAQVGGFLDAIHFKDGQIVDEGDPLFDIDPRPCDAALAQAEAQAEAAKAAEFVRGKTLPKNVFLLPDSDFAVTSSYGLRWDAPNETAYPSTFVAAKARSGWRRSASPMRDAHGRAKRSTRL